MVSQNRSDRSGECTACMLLAEQLALACMRVQLWCHRTDWTGLSLRAFLSELPLVFRRLLLCPQS